MKTLEKAGLKQSWIFLKGNKWLQIYVRTNDNEPTRLVFPSGSDGMSLTGTEPTKELSPQLVLLDAVIRLSI